MIPTSKKPETSETGNNWVAQVQPKLHIYLSTRIITAPALTWEHCPF